jgi:drug/metabolite transporter (DMT)-like permease
MIWLYLALTAYFINAVVSIIDKHLLSGHIPKNNAYAFGVAILSVFAVVLIPFGVHWYGWLFFIISFLCGATFFLALVFLYKCIIESDITVSSTQIGTMGIIFTYLFSLIILKDALTPHALVALVLLVIGTILLGRLERHILVDSILSGVFFGLSIVLLKLSFNYSDFINGLFWTRISFAGTGILALLLPSVRQDIKFVFKKSPGRTKFTFVYSKILATLGSLILYFSIKLGNVSIVNALVGLQFMFIFVLALILHKKVSGIKEKMTQEVLLHKISGIILVIVGLGILFLE